MRRVTEVSSSLLCAASRCAGGCRATRQSTLATPAGTRDRFHDARRCTWLSPDLSPDGGKIAFELLGDLYLLDSNGGAARADCDRHAVSTPSPRSRPTASSIAFLSDRLGIEDVWISNATERSAGRSPTLPATDSDVAELERGRKDDLRLALSPRLCRVRASVRQRRTTEAPKVIVPIGDGKSNSTVGAEASRDGRWLYYASQVGPNDSEPPAWVIRRRDFRSGHEETLVEPPRSYRPDLVLGTFFRPLPSPDGKLLVYATRYGSEMWLRVLDLETRERPLARQTRPA